jgi:hypothetical protein
MQRSLEEIERETFEREMRRRGTLIVSTAPMSNSKVTGRPGLTSPQ